MAMKVLVTGNNGYIGNVMCPMLMAEGFDVIGLDSNYFDDCEFEKRKVKIKQIIKDIRQIEEADFQGIDAVIHLAGLSNDPIGELNPGITEVINLDASVKCAQLARQAGVNRFVFASSCSVYGVAKDGLANRRSGPSKGSRRWLMIIFPRSSCGTPPFTALRRSSASTWSSTI